MKQKKLIYIIIFGLIGLTACAPAYFKDAKHFVKSKGDNIAILFIPPGNNIVYTNHKTVEIPGIDTLSENEKAIALKRNSEYLNQLNDVSVYEMFVNKFLTNLAKTKLNIYTPEFEDEFYKNEKRLIVDMAKIEFDEYYDMVRDEKTYFGKLYYNETYINAFAINVWFDFIQDENTKLLYATNRITDYHKGWFVEGYFEDEIYYYEDNTALRYEHIEYFLDVVAQRYAEYMYDYIMTDYVYKKHTISETNVPDSITLHYNKKKDRIFIADDDYKFIEIE